jgi:hypothetical protein
MKSLDALPREMAALIEYTTESAADASSLTSLQENITRAVGERLPLMTGPAFICWIPMIQRRSF